MRAIQSDGDLRDRSDGCYWGYQGRRDRALSLQDMSTPAVMTPNLTRLRQLQIVDKSSKKKKLYKSKIRKDVPAELTPIGDNLEACSVDNSPREIKEASRPSTAGRCKTLTKEPVTPTKPNSDSCKRCSIPCDTKQTDKLTGIGDEGFYDDDIQHHPKIAVIEEVKELIRKSEAQNIENVKNNETTSKGSDSLSGKRKKRAWTAILLWVFTFSGALTVYFSVFVYLYEIEPVYSTMVKILGLKEELPPPPPTLKDQFYILLDQISVKLYNLRLLFRDKLSL